MYRKFGLGLFLMLASLTILKVALPDVFSVAFGSPLAILRLLAILGPVLMVALAVHACLATGRILIAGEGIYAAGGVAVAIIGTSIPESPLGLWGGLVFAFVVAAAIGTFISWLRESRGVHEVISGLLINYILHLLTRFLANGPFRDPTSDAPHTRELAWTLPLFSATADVNMTVALGAVLTIAYIYILRNTVLGQYLRSLGISDGIAKTAGLSPFWARTLTMAIASGLIGVAGAITIGSAGPFRRFPADFYGSGVGFDGLIAGLLAGPSAWFIVPSSLLLASLSHISDALSLSTSLPRQVGSISGAVLFLTTAYIRFRKHRRS